MWTRIRFGLFPLFPLFSLFSLGALPASAEVTATPAFYDFGPVAVGRSVSTTITFHNSSAAPVFFDLRCGGDSSAFSCFSLCGFLPARGNCPVQVRFESRNGDDLRRTFWISGSAGGEAAFSTVYGTDRKRSRWP